MNKIDIMDKINSLLFDCKTLAIANDGLLTLISYHAERANQKEPFSHCDLVDSVQQHIASLVVINKTVIEKVTQIEALVEKLAELNGAEAQR